MDGVEQAQIDADLAFLRDSIITTEVNIARIFNHDVRRRRKVREMLPGPSRLELLES